MYDPIHMIGDFSVTFEHCDVADMISNLAGLASLDWGAVSDRVV